MWVIDDPAEVQEAFKDPANIAALLGQEKDHPFSPLIAVGLDLYKDRSVTDKAKGMGVTSSASCWIQRTGRGGNTLLYAHPDIELKRDTLQEGSALDLLTHGYTLIPPSNTDKQGGGPYTWVKGHSPWDIPLVDLVEPPQALLAWWLELHATPPPYVRTAPGGTLDMPSCFQGPIDEGLRNTELTARAGYLHRMLPNDALVRDLVHGINQQDCKPPLAHGEVENILRSILPREGASHFRGVQPAKLEVVR